MKDMVVTFLLFDFSRRSGRIEWWSAHLALAVVCAVFWSISRFALGLELFFSAGAVTLSMVLLLWAAVMVLATVVRRLRDVGWPAWALLLFVIPLAGQVLWLYLGLKGSNRSTEGPGAF